MEEYALKTQIVWAIGMLLGGGAFSAA